MKSATEVSAASMSAKRQKIKHDDDEKEDPSPLPPSIADAPWKPEDPVSFESLTISDKAMWNNIKADIQALKSTYGQQTMKKNKKDVRSERSIVNDKMSLRAAVEKLLIKIEQAPTMTTVHSMHNPCLLHTFALSGVLSQCPLDFKVETLKKLISFNPSALLWSDRHYQKCPFMEDLVMFYPELGPYVFQHLPEVFSSDDEDVQAHASSVSAQVAQRGSVEDIRDYFEAYPQGLFMISDGTPILMSIIARIDGRYDSNGSGDWDPDELAQVLMDLIDSFPAAFHEDLPPLLKDFYQAELCQVFFGCALRADYGDEDYRAECFKFAKFFLQRAPQEVLDETAVTDCLNALNNGSTLSDSMFDFLVTLLRVLRSFEFPVSNEMEEYFKMPVISMLVPLIDREVSIANEFIKLHHVCKMMEKMTTSSSGRPAVAQALGRWVSKRFDPSFVSLGRVKSVRAEIESVRKSLRR